MEYCKYFTVLEMTLRNSFLSTQTCSEMTYVLTFMENANIGVWS